MRISRAITRPTSLVMASNANVHLEKDAHMASNAASACPVVASACAPMGEGTTRARSAEARASVSMVDNALHAEIANKAYVSTAKAEPVARIAGEAFDASMGSHATGVRSAGGAASAASIGRKITCSSSNLLTYQETTAMVVAPVCF